MSAIPVYSGVIPFSSSNQANALVERDASGNFSANAVTLAQLITTILSGNSTTKTTNYTVLGTEALFFIGNATSGAFAFTLPPASAVGKLVLVFIKKDSSGNAVTLTTVGENIIVTGSATTTFALSARGNAALIWSDGTNWYGLKS